MCLLLIFVLIIRMDYKLYKRVAALVVIAVFAVSSIPAAAGAHYDAGFEHESGNKKHNHAPQFHLFEFSNYGSIAPRQAHISSKAPVIGNTNAPCGYMADHTGHIHAAKKGCHKQQDKSFIGAEEQKNFGFIKLSIITPSVKAYKSLSHNTRSIRGPPSSSII